MKKKKGKEKKEARTKNIFTIDSSKSI